MTDYRRLDPIRRDAGPLPLDLIEAFERGRLTRREFVRRGTVLGMSLGVLGTVLAACGGSEGGGTGGTAATGVGGGGETGARVQQGGSMRVASIAPAGPLDPVAMVDLASYAVVAQCFEFLTYSRGNLQLSPGIAESWKPNADGSEWTFTIRDGIQWQDGSPFSTEDIIATMERMVAGGNSGLLGVIEAGSVTAPDERTVVFRLTGPNGNLPYLVSSDNPQTVITPKAYVAGTTLDKQPNGTGPWKLDRYDGKTGATYSRNESWWGGKTPLDTVEWTFFQDLQPQVVALQSGQTDAVVQFSVLGGEGLLNAPNIKVIRLKSAAHRQIWMRCDKGQFTDKRVRQALGFALDREAMVQSLFSGFADLGNDNLFAPVYPYTDTTVPQRPHDVERAKQLLADAGVSNLRATLHAVKLQDVPDLAVLVKGNAADVGIQLDVSVEDTGPFYGRSWCPAEPKDPPCSGAAEIGIVDYGHRGTPDVYLNASLNKGGAWNSSQYTSAAYSQAFRDFQASVGVDEQTKAARVIQELLLEDSPLLVPYFYNYLSAHADTVGGISVTGIGHMFLEKAGKV
jgi:peptide/nickel transport system substrate-binding protein